MDQISLNFAIRFYSGEYNVDTVNLHVNKKIIERNVEILYLYKRNTGITIK